MIFIEIRIDKLAILKSKNIDKESRDRLIRHTLQEMRLTRLGGLEKGPETTEEFIAQQRPAQALNKELVKQPGFPTEAKLPVTSAEIGVAPQRPVIKSR